MRSSFVHCTECGFDFPAATTLVDGKHVDGFGDQCGPCVPVPDPGTLIGYQVVVAEDNQFAKLESQVEALIVQGWELHGSLVLWPEIPSVRQACWVREMVLRAKAEAV